MLRLLAIAAALGAVWGTSTSAEEPGAKVSILLDCAVGSEIGDAFALAVATADPTIELRGVTTVSGYAEDRAWIVCRFLSAIGQRDIPVAFGRGNQPPAEIGAQFQYRYHPAVLFGRTAKPAKESAVELLRQQLTASPARTTIVATGPLTNIGQLLEEHADVKDRIERIVIAAGKEELALDVAAARRVLAVGIPIVLVQQEVIREACLDDQRLQRIFAASTPRTMQLQTLYELWQGEEPALADALAVALASSNSPIVDAVVLTPARVTIDDAGRLHLAEGDSHVRIVKSVRFGALQDWTEKQLVRGEPVLPRQPVNRTQPVERGRMPHRVHVFEDYETDIERRWWLAGILESINVPPESSRSCRGMLTMDFDDQQGDAKTMYRAVVFNPVPGPPMGKSPRLSFRCWLKGTDTLRVQIYSLSNGYHRYLSLADLPQERWLDLAVDMTKARRPDGSGGPLSENERIDDIQFYVDPRAELLIDDVVLYDAAAPEEERPFPKRIQFTGWFDTGQQGKEWPGTFEIPPDSGYFWKGARSRPQAVGHSEIRIDLRGKRPLGNRVQVDLRYKVAAAGKLEILLRDTSGRRELRAIVNELKAGDWEQLSLTLSTDPKEIPPRSGQDLTAADELRLTFAGAGALLVDDLLVYEPGR